MSNSRPTPQESPSRTDTAPRAGTIGLPAASHIMDHRFPLTPEGAGLLVDRGFRVLVERGAAAGIHYSDAAYTARGAEIVERPLALGCDIVIMLQFPGVADARLLRRGGLLLTNVRPGGDILPAVRSLIERKTICLDIENIGDENGRLPFADILREIDGRAALAVASALLADSIHGKGILLGGVAGVVPCEVCIVGSGMAARAAAQSAIGQGATVRMFDSDTYSLRRATDAIGPGVIGSSLHPKVFESALTTADVVVVTDTRPPGFSVGIELMRTMKRGVIAFDLTSRPGSAFPAMATVNLDLASPSDTDPTDPVRMCYINAGNAVPRTVAMALGNTFANMLDGILVCDGVTNALRLNAGLRRAAVTFLGQCTNQRLAAALGLRPIDINLFIQFS